VRRQRRVLILAAFLIQDCATYPGNTPDEIRAALSDRQRLQATIAGRLTERRSGEPVMAQILLMPPAGRTTLAETRSDAQGFFVFRSVEPSNYRLVVSEAGLGGNRVRQVRVRPKERLFLYIKPRRVFRVYM
jgi:hypothetical protein